MTDLSSFKTIQKGKVDIDEKQCFLKVVRSISEGPAFVRELIQNAYDASDGVPTIRISNITPDNINKNSSNNQEVDRINKSNDKKRIDDTIDLIESLKSLVSITEKTDGDISSYLTKEMESFEDKINDMLLNVNYNNDKNFKPFPDEDENQFQARLKLHRDINSAIEKNKEVFISLLTRWMFQPIQISLPFLHLPQTVDILNNEIPNESNDIKDVEISEFFEYILTNSNSGADDSFFSEHNVNNKNNSSPLEKVHQKNIPSINKSNLQNQSIYVLEVENPRGMLPNELEALTKIGYSTKTDREVKDYRDLRGEFGTGFVLSLSPHIEPESVDVLTACNGQLWQLRLWYQDNNYKTMPLKTLTCIGESSNEITRITVRFKKESKQVKRYLKQIADTSSRTINIEIDGKSKATCKPLSERKVGTFDYYKKTDDKNEFFIHTDHPNFILPFDSITVSVMDLPVTYHQSSYSFLTGYQTGDHMPQNERGSIYLDSNDIYINARTVSLNSSRDSIMRDSKFDYLKEQLDVCAKAKLLQKVNEWAEDNAKDYTRDSLERLLSTPYLYSQRDLYRHQDLANILTLSVKIKEYFQQIDNGKCADDIVSNYKDIIQYLIERRLFGQAESRDPEMLNLKEVHDFSFGCVLYDDEQTDASRETLVRSLLLNQEHRILINESVYFMGHFKYAVSEIANSAVPDYVYSLTDILTKKDVRNLLEKKGILAKLPPIIRTEIPINSLSNKQLNFLKTIKTIFDMGIKDLSGSSSIVFQTSFGLGKSENPADEEVLGLVETYIEADKKLVLLLGVDHPILNKAFEINWKKSCYYLLSIIIFELCHVAREYVNFSELLQSLKINASPAKLEETLNEFLLSIDEAIFDNY